MTFGCGSTFHLPLYNKEKGKDGNQQHGADQGHQRQAFDEESTCAHKAPLPIISQ